MNKTVFYILIGVGVIILFYMLKGGGASKQTSSNGGSDDLGDVVSDIMNDQGAVTKKDCRKHCQGLCSGLKYWGGGRQRCKKECKPDCSKYGYDYATENYP